MNVMKEQRRCEEEDGNTRGVGQIRPLFHLRRRARLGAAVCECVTYTLNLPPPRPPPWTLSLATDVRTGDPGDFRARETRNANGLCRQVGLIIIHSKSVKTCSQTAPGRRRVKNPFVGSVP